MQATAAEMALPAFPAEEEEDKDGKNSSDETNDNNNDNNTQQHQNLQYLLESGPLTLMEAAASESDDEISARAEALASTGSADALVELVRGVLMCRRFSLADVLVRATVPALLKREHVDIAVVKELMLGFQHAPDVLLANAEALIARVGEEAARPVLEALALQFHAHRNQFGAEVPRVLPSKERRATLAASSWLQYYAPRDWPFDGSYTSGNGDVRWVVDANVRGRFVTGHFFEADMGLQSALVPGARCIALWEKNDYYTGEVEEIWQGCALFRCVRGHKWVYAEDVFREVPVTANARRVFARRGRAQCLSLGLVVALDGDHLVIKFDGTPQEQMVERAHAWACSPFELRDTKTCFAQGFTQGVSLTDGGDDNGTVIEATYQFPAARLEGVANLRFATDDGNSFSGTLSCGEDDDTAWIGVRRRAVSALMWSLALEEKAPPCPSQTVNFDGKRTYVHINGAERVLFFGEYQPFAIDMWIYNDDYGDDDDDDDDDAHKKADDEDDGERRVIASKSDKYPNDEVGDFVIGLVDGHVFVQTPDLKSPDPIPPRTWTRVGAAFDGRTWMLIVGGETVAHREGMPRELNAQVPILIGAELRRGEPASFFKGHIREVRLFVGDDLRLSLPLATTFENLVVDVSPSSLHGTVLVTSLAPTPSPLHKPTVNVARECWTHHKEPLPSDPRWTDRTDVFLRHASTGSLSCTDFVDLTQSFVTVIEPMAHVPAVALVLCRGPVWSMRPALLPNAPPMPGTVAIHVTSQLIDVWYTTESGEFKRLACASGFNTETLPPAIAFSYRADVGELRVRFGEDERLTCSLDLDRLCSRVKGAGGESVHHVDAFVGVVGAASWQFRSSGTLQSQPSSGSASHDHHRHHHDDSDSDNSLADDDNEYLDDKTGLCVTRAALHRLLAGALLEYEGNIRGGVFHDDAWKFNRQPWRERVQASTTVPMLIDCIVSLAEALQLSEKLWSDDARMHWQLALLQAIEYAELVQCVVDLALVVPDEAFVANWRSDKKSSFFEVLHFVRLVDHTARLPFMQDDVAVLSGEQYPLQACREALLAREFSVQDAVQMLQKIGPAAVRQRARVQEAHVLVQDDWAGPDVEQRPSPTTRVVGQWVTNRGILVLSDGGPCSGHLVRGQYATRNGSVHGVAWQRLSDGLWEMQGHWLQSDTRLWQAVRLAGRPDGKLIGKQHGPVKVSQWKCTPEPSVLQRASTGFCGLVNLGNTCYQNAFLQALFMSHAFRERVLAAPLKRAAGEEKKVAGEEEEEKKEEERADEKKMNVVAFQFQRLLSFLEGSVRPTMNQTFLKSILMPPFNEKHQQDSIQYGQYMFDQVATALDDQGLADVPSMLFGGVTKTVNRCERCQSLRVSSESFRDFGVSFPRNYEQITDIAIITNQSASGAAPEGFDRVPADLNTGRKKSPFTYVCVRRDPNAQPITDVRAIVLEQKDGRDPTTIVPDGYTLVEGDVNPGGHVRVFLCVQRHPKASPVTQIEVSFENVAPDGFELVDVDLNGGRHKPVFVCLKRGVAVRDIAVVHAPSAAEASQVCPDGYTLVPCSFSLEHDDAFLVYSAGGSCPPITSVEVVARAKAGDNDELVQLDDKYALRIGRGEGSPILALEVFRSPEKPPRYGGHALLDLAPDFESTKNLYGQLYHLKQGAVVQFDRSQESKTFPGFVVEGPYTPGEGKIEGLLFETARVGDGDEEKTRGSGMQWVLRGTWQQKGFKHPQPFEWRFDDGAFSSFSGEWNSGSKAGNWNGIKTAAPSAPPPPIADICVIHKEVDELPPGFRIMSGNLNARAPGDCPDVRIAVRRASAGDGSGDDARIVADVGIMWGGGIGAAPEGYSVVSETPSGTSANLNAGIDGAPELFLCVRHVAAAECSEGADVVLDLKVFVQSAEVPDRFTKVTQSFIGLEANLNPYEDAHVALHRGKWVSAQERHPLDGRYETTTSVWDGKVVRPVTCRYVWARYWPSVSDAKAGRPTKRYMEGILVDKPDGQGWQLYGRYQSGKLKHPGVLTVHFDADFSEFRGDFSHNKNGGTWLGYKDEYATLAFSADLGSHWRDGEELFSSMAGGDDIDAMVRQTLSVQALRGSNRLHCSTCEERGNFHRFTLLHSCPAYLLVAIRRFSYDYKTQRMKKILNDVAFGRELHLPVPPEEFHEAIFECKEDVDAVRGNRYALYAIVVHAGAGLDGGHYFTYARDLNDADATEQWRKYDDTRVFETSWDAIQGSIRDNPTETAYLLFYKRIDNQGTRGGGGDDDDDGGDGSGQQLLRGEVVRDNVQKRGSS